MTRASLLRLFVCLSLTAFAKAEAPPAGLRILTAGHSFHVWMPGLLIETAKNAGITGHTQVGLSSIGGSRTIQHWDAQGDKQKIKPVLMEGKADVLTLSPIFLPDAGIENFVKLGLEHNPKLRITVQEFWMTFDDGSLWGKPLNGKVIDRDTKTMPDLHAAHDGYFKSMDDHVRELNAKYAKDKPAVFVVPVVPVGQAVMALCDLIIQGQSVALGFQTDTTRITTLKLNNDHSALRFPNLPSVQQAGHGIDYMIHHLLSHSDAEDYLKVNQFFMEQLAYLGRKLAAIQEGSRTLLDNTMIMHCSSMMVGAKHNNDELPVIVLGGAAGRLKGGRVID